jgi:hypothetical protein
MAVASAEDRSRASRGAHPDRVFLPELLEPALVIGDRAGRARTPSPSPNERNFIELQDPHRPATVGFRLGVAT